VARGQEARVKIRLALGLSLSIAACDAAPDKDAPKPSATPAATAPAATAPASSAPAAAAAVTAPKPASPANLLAGTWEGSYDAKKGAVSLPPKVKDKALAADDGKAASGPGKVEITIGPDGAVQGKSTGALGACTLVGRAEEGTIRAKVNPDDPRAPGAMTGVFYGTLKEDTIKGELHVAGPDATVVRESAIELKRK
jgi:hypothetical protein